MWVICKWDTILYNHYIMTLYNDSTLSKYHMNFAGISNSSSITLEYKTHVTMHGFAC